MEIKRERQSDHLPNECGNGLSAAVCGEDMEGDWNTLKTCLLENAKVVVWCDTGSIKAQDSLVVETMRF